MSALRSMLGKLFFSNSRLSAIEKEILNSARDLLNPELLEFWDRQVTSINKVQRLPKGVETNFYRMRNGRPYFDEAIAFPNRAEELLFAKVDIDLLSQYKVIAKIWCVKGFIFSIEYVGSITYIEEAVERGRDADIKIASTIINDLS